MGLTFRDFPRKLRVDFAPNNIAIITNSREGNVAIFNQSCRRRYRDTQRLRQNLRRPGKLENAAGLEFLNPDPFDLPVVVVNVLRQSVQNRLYDAIDIASHFRIRKVEQSYGNRRFC